MRAYILPGHGEQPLLTDVSMPELADGEVRVRITASSMTPNDIHVATGVAAAYRTYVYPVTLGTDLAGTVDAVGAGVDDLAPGDRVFGLVREQVAARGSFAELVAVPREWLVPTPAELDDLSAGALGLAALTAWQCVSAVAPESGETVLVNGAAGGVGSYAVQLLTARGVSVIATARPGEQTAHVRELGATDVVDWTAGDLAEPVRALRPEGVAAVVDLVHLDQGAFAQFATQVLGPGGRVASTMMAADPARLPGIRAANVITEIDQDALRALAELAGTGRLRVPVTRVFDLNDIGQAFSALGAGVTGKLAIRI